MEQNQSILIIYNPISGSGNAHNQALLLAENLSSNNLSTTVLESKRTANEYEELRDQIESSSTVVVVGGDGTLKNLLGILSRTKVPVYMLP
ncbi:MAG: diacylglycerol kinase family protein [Bdellovibrionota bacterium]